MDMSYRYSESTRPRKKPTRIGDKHPGDPSDNVIEQKFGVIHLSNTGHGGRKRPDDRHKASQDDCLGAVFLIKTLRPNQMVLIE